jgi:bifunctional non-homologous end joining protein LigD
VEVEGRQLKLSNLDKVLYPEVGFTKGQVIDYYTRIAPVLLPHLLERPLTLKRYPNGVDAPYFYEKRCPKHRPDWVQTTEVWSKRTADNLDFCLANDLPTLVWVANLASLELHTSLSRGAIDQPSMMVFDLDPGAPATVVECAQVALWLRELLDDLGLESVVKTSGSKGMQLYVPLNTAVTYDDTKPFSHALAQLLERREPKLVVSQMAKELRKGKVFIDWSQNDRVKTTVCVYSLRAREKPTISAPLTWAEVEELHAGGDPDAATITAADVLERVAESGDPFAPVLELEQELPRPPVAE